MTASLKPRNVCGSVSAGWLAHPNTRGRGAGNLPAGGGGGAPPTPAWGWVGGETRLSPAMPRLGAPYGTLSMAGPGRRVGRSGAAACVRGLPRPPPLVYERPPLRGEEGENQRLTADVRYSAAGSPRPSARRIVEHKPGTSRPSDSNNSPRSPCSM